MNATMAFIPTLAAVLTFITYGLSGHALDAATIFSGLQFFNVLKTPISFLPMALTAVSDAVVAIGRIGVLLRSEEIPQALNIDASSKYAIDVFGDFTFEEKADHQAISSETTSISEKTDKDLKDPFALRHLNIRIPRGYLVCIVGRVGTGKSALLSGLLGEMRQSKGHMIFGGPVSFVPQEPWIHSGTIRDNITFSAPEKDIDRARLNWVIDASCLKNDLQSMSNGLWTQVGEKGMTFSGGQRQRIALARAAYDSTSSIVLLDDPLSAVDANVGHHILQNCLLNGPLATRTRILVTHHLDVLSKADMVIVMDRDERNIGRVVQQGSYATLCSQPGILRKLISEFAPRPTTAYSTATSGVSSLPGGSLPPTSEMEVIKPDAANTSNRQDVDEERETGAIGWNVYHDYVRATGTWTWVLVAGVLLCFTQLANVGNSLFLGFWLSNEFNMSQMLYMVIYAGLGVAIAIFTWSASLVMFLAGIRASYSLFNCAWEAVLRTPTSWHDQTPSGRIINRLSKDIEMLDDRLAFAWEQFLTTALAVVGTFGLVLYVYPYLGLAFIPLGFFYYLCASYYRQTSREIKRVDSIAKSTIYSSFGEQLTGLSVIRAFRRQGIFQERLQKAINVECQAYLVTLTIQRWLGVRLDFFSNILVMLIAIFGSVFRNSVNPSKFGVVLTYTLAAASFLANLVSLYAQVEQEMNNAERVLHYTNLPCEAPSTLPSDPDHRWPTVGSISFENVSLRYRPNLPLVLKGLSFTVKEGEKIGVIGRTGAGKSSIVHAIFRMVEIESGQMLVDGVNINHVGVDTLRSRLAIIPQDAFLFEGTIRHNIDPTRSHDDHALHQLLQLIHADPAATRTLRDKLRLDNVVTHGGGNFSAGEKQLIALIRALVKGSKILVLDEATSSVDSETDALIQRVIQTRFKEITLICIAHRLQTVAYYDKILLLDDGQIVEFDEPLVLFDRHSIFRSLCDRVHLSRRDLLHIKHDALYAAQTARDR